MMSPVTAIRVLFLAAMLLAPAFAHASVDLNFTGTASAGSYGDVYPYIQPTSVDTHASFAGQPVNISIFVADDPTGPYVQTFSISWSNQTYAAPIITSWSGTGFPNAPENDYAFGFYSAVNLSGSGGSIHIFPTPGYSSLTDADFDFNFSFSNNGPTGNGSIFAYLNFINDPTIGPYDALSSVSFAVPEPAAWVMLLVGLGAVGGVLRAVRSRASRPA